MIKHALPTCTQWVDALSACMALPVSPDTVAEIGELAALEGEQGSVNPHLIAQNIGGDPLAVLQILRRVAGLCQDRGVSAPQTLTAAIIMLGVGPFFREFGQPVPVDEHLQGHPEALQELQDLTRRSRRAARLAVNVASERQDEDADALQEAALLHEFTEMLLWCHAPVLAARLRALRAGLPTEASAADKAALQRQVLGVSVLDLSQALIEAWQLPKLLMQVMEPAQAGHPQVLTVLLAVRIVRHSRDHGERLALPALSDDIAELAQLLGLSLEGAQSKLLELDF